MKREPSAAMSSDRRSACFAIGMGLLVADQAGLAETGKDVPAQATLSRTSAEAFKAACRVTAPIRDREDLEAWLPAAGSMPASPLAPLSAGGRRRLLASLVFRDGYWIGIDTADLEAELTLSQAYRVLALFGFQGAIVDMPETRIETAEDRTVAAWRSELQQAR